MTGLMLWAALASARAQEPGRAIFDAAGCRACHRIAGRGGNTGPDLTLAGFRRSPEWLRAWLRDPRAWKPDTKMPNLRLQPGDLSALVDYLSALKGQDWRGAPPWRGRPDPGRMIFARAGCVACHGALGKGGHPNNNVEGGAIPALSALAGTYTEEELIQRIGHGKKPDKKEPSGPEPLAEMPAWKDVLGPEELAAVAKYVKTLASPAKEDW